MYRKTIMEMLKCARNSQEMIEMSKKGVKSRRIDDEKKLRFCPSELVCQLHDLDAKKMADSLDDQQNVTSFRVNEAFPNEPIFKSFSTCSRT
jgi:hypothetical protein